MSVIEVKGYYTGSDYMGLVNGDYMRFESDAAYKEYLESEEVKGEEVDYIKENDLDMNPKEWTVSYIKGLNERLKRFGLPQFVLDEENKRVYKDELHKILGIGLDLK